jgi:sugar phosphate isomerase/epimerase
MARITAMSSVAYAHYTLYQALPRIAARGFDRVEIGSFPDYCFHFNAGSPTAPELKEMLARHGLTPTVLNWTPGVPLAYDPGSVEPWIEAFERKLAYAAEVGFTMMTMHFGQRNDRVDQDAQLATAAKAYDRVADLAAKHSIRTLLEVPHLYTIHWTTDASLRLLESLPNENVGALVDSSHWGNSGYDIDEFLDRLGGRLWHVHLRDAKGPGTRPCRQNLTLTPGAGVVDFARLAQALDRVGYDGEVTTEFEYFDVTLDEIERQYDLGLRHLAEVGWRMPPGVRY